jgi:hypothetical protein
MAADLPPNLANTAASAIVRAAEKQNNSNTNAPSEKKAKDDGRDDGNASIRRKNEPGTRP